MKIRMLFTLALFGIIISCFPQQDMKWSKWEWLNGKWKGQGNGQPGQGAGTFSFAFDLDKNIIVRKSHSEYPASENKPAIIHDDLMIVYMDFYDSPTKAIYFDNEGHTINYTISYPENSIIFTSEKIPDAPVFRLTYTLLDNGTVNTKFETSQDGENFTTYIEGISEKILNNR
jgi:hypothetical protein